MKRLRKGLAFVLCACLVTALVPPAATHAGGAGAAICVKYAIIDSHGGCEIYMVADDDQLTQTVSGPEGGNTERFYSNNF